MTEAADEKPEFLMQPVLSVSDVEASVQYYCSKLGFKTSWRHGDDKLVIAAVERKGIELILENGTVVPSSQRPVVIAMSMYTLGTLGDLHEELTKRGALVRKAPFQVIWQQGVHQMEVEDLDGNLLLFWGELAK